MNHGRGRFGVELVILCDPPEVVQPSERPFYNPSQRDEIELLRAFVGSKHDFKLASKHLVGRLPQLITPVAIVGKYLPQPRELVGEFLQRRFSSFAVVDVRLVNGDGHRETQRVNHNLVFPPYYFLVAIDAALLVHMLRCLDTPQVYDADTWASLPT